MKKANRTSFKKGNIPWNKGKKGIRLSPESEFKKGNIPANYKGENAHYTSKHTWLHRNFGSPVGCEYCGRNDPGKRKYDWANLSGKHLRKRLDWVRLCKKCHAAFDCEGYFAKEKTGKRSSSNHRNISWDKERKKWLVVVGFRGKQIHVGRFDSIKKAIKARDVKRGEIMNEAKQIRIKMLKKLEDK